MPFCRSQLPAFSASTPARLRENRGRPASLLYATATQVQLTVRPQPVCQQQWPAQAKLWSSRRAFCAGTLGKPAGICGGDYGGPLFVKGRTVKQDRLVGIAAFNGPKGCGRGGLSEWQRGQGAGSCAFLWPAPLHGKPDDCASWGRRASWASYPLQELRVCDAALCARVRAVTMSLLAPPLAPLPCRRLPERGAVQGLDRPWRAGEPCAAAADAAPPPVPGTCSLSGPACAFLPHNVPFSKLRPLLPSRRS